MKSVLISKSEYARRRGCRPSAVTRAVAAGRISQVDGKIDPIAADAQWLANSRRRIRSTPARAARVPETKAVADAAVEPQDVLLSRAQLEYAQAKIAELTLGRLRGELLERARVESGAFSAARGLRDRLTSAASQLGAGVAPLSSASDCEALLRDAFRKLLLDFSAELAAMIGPPPAVPAPAAEAAQPA